MMRYRNAERSWVLSWDNTWKFRVFHSVTNQSYGTKGPYLCLNSPSGRSRQYYFVLFWIHQTYKVYLLTKSILYSCFITQTISFHQGFFKQQASYGRFFENWKSVETSFWKLIAVCKVRVKYDFRPSKMRLGLHSQNSLLHLCILIPEYARFKETALFSSSSRFY